MLLFQGNSGDKYCFRFSDFRRQAISGHPIRLPALVPARRDDGGSAVHSAFCILRSALPHPPSVPEPAPILWGPSPFPLRTPHRHPSLTVGASQTRPPLSPRLSYSVTQSLSHSVTPSRRLPAIVPACRDGGGSVVTALLRHSVTPSTQIPRQTRRKKVTNIKVCTQHGWKECEIGP
jgi:hypothetical protein